MRGAAFLSVAIVFGAVAGCDDPPPLSSIEAFCDGVCQGAVRCSSGLTWQGCYDTCRTDPQNQSLATVRPEAAAVVKGCLSALDCATIFNGPYDACWDRARQQTKPSPHLIDFCPAYATSLFNCGYSLSVEHCEADLDIWTDAFLDGLAACARKPTCEEVDACLQDPSGGT